MSIDAAHTSDPSVRAEEVAPVRAEEVAQLSAALRHRLRPVDDRYARARLNGRKTDRPRPAPRQRADGDGRSSSNITLLEMEPELCRLLAPEQLALAERFLLPVTTLEKNGDPSALFAESGAFGALLLEGLLLQTVQIAGHRTVRAVGPGALVPVEGAVDWTPLAGSETVAATQTRLVVLGRSFLLAAHRWPRLVVCLHERMLEQSARLTKQLAISHLPRVEERVLAMLKLLAETWGKVTPAGIRLQLPITQGTLGALIGARRPTVSIALKALAEREAVIRCDGGWLITGG